MEIFDKPFSKNVLKEMQGNFFEDMYFDGF